MDDSLILDIRGGDSSKGARLVQYHYTAQSHQHWVFDYISWELTTWSGIDYISWEFTISTEIWLHQLFLTTSAENSQYQLQFNYASWCLTLSAESLVRQLRFDYAWHLPTSAENSQYQLWFDFPSWYLLHQPGVHSINRDVTAGNWLHQLRLHSIFITFDFFKFYFLCTVDCLAPNYSNEPEKWDWDLRMKWEMAAGKGRNKDERSSMSGHLYIYMFILMSIVLCMSEFRTLLLSSLNNNNRIWRAAWNITFCPYPRMHLCLRGYI